MIRFHLTISGTIPGTASLEEAEQQLDFAMDAADYLRRGIHIAERITRVTRPEESRAD